MTPDEQERAMRDAKAVQMGVEARLEYRAAAQRAKTTRKWNLVVLIITFVSMIAALVGAVSITVNRRLQEQAATRRYQVAMEAQFKAIQARMADDGSKLQVLHETIEKIGDALPPSVQVAKLTAQVDLIQTQVKMLNDAIGQSPDRVLSVPLLKKDVDNLRETYRHDLDSTQAEINRVSDQNKWFIGLLVTISISAFGLALSSFKQTAKTNENVTK
jgi:hypothetical protein